MDNIFSMVFSLFGTTSDPCAEQRFLGLYPWYHYLQVQYNNVTNSCEVNFQIVGGHSSVLLVLLAIIDDLMMIAGLAAVAFLIYAGIKYITSQGSPAETAKALSTIIYALVGLAIAVVAIPFVSYIGNHFASTQGISPVNLSGGGSLNLNSLPNPVGVTNGSIVQTLLQDVFGIIGGLALIFLVIGGLRYVFSNGDPQSTASAKGTIIYSLVGLIVAIVAESIVALVLGKLQ